MVRSYVFALGLTLSLLSIGCSKKSPPQSSPDHTVSVLNEPPPWNRPTDCRANIKTAICLVNPARESEDSLKRPCLEGSDKYAAAFEELYDAYPPEFQKMFCSLRRIFVENNFGATAYAQSFVGSDGKQVPGVAMGIRRSLLDQPFSISHWSTWKEQLNFGGDPHDYTLKMKYPSMVFSNESKLDFMYFVFAHEFGHLFDFANAVNQFDYNEKCAESGECVSVPGTWSAFSWKTLNAHHANADYTHANLLCFYGCEKVMSQTQAVELYDGLQTSPFISNYAATNAWDDFAETVAYYVLQNTMKKSLVLSYADDRSFDATARLATPAMAYKANYVEHFLKSSPNYP
jgi:Putative zinc-binding metallo-peptidase